MVENLGSRVEGRAAALPERAAERRVVFDEVAELYDRIRPSYPEPLFDDLATLAGLGRGARVLEIGAGTGQATLPLLRRDCRVLCIEPGPNMARILERKAAGLETLRVRQSTFEAWPEEETGFDLVLSAQAFHWIEPAVRFVKTARILRRGGSLAILLNRPSRGRGVVNARIDRAYADHAAEIARQYPGKRAHAGFEEIRHDIASSELFELPEFREYRWSQEHTADEYADLMRTQSDHRLLAPAKLERLLAAVREAIEATGGRIAVSYQALLHVARKR